MYMMLMGSNGVEGARMAILCGNENMLVDGS